MKSKKDIFLTHFKGLFIKRYHYSKRDKKGILCEIIVPIIMVIIGLSIMTISFLKESGALIMEPSMLGNCLLSQIEKQKRHIFNPF